MKLNELMEQFADLKAKLKELKDTKENLRTEILTILKTEDLTESTSETCTLRLVTQTRNTFNKALALEKLEDNAVRLGEEYDASAFLEPSDFEILKIDRITQSCTEASVNTEPGGE